MADESEIDPAVIAAVYRAMGQRRWVGKSAAEKRAHALHMVACRLRKAKLRAKQEGEKWRKHT